MAESTDPWYSTEPRPSTNVTTDGSPVRSRAQFRVRSKRPVLSCWQTNAWEHGDVRVKYPGLLKGKPGVKLSNALIDVLSAAFLNAPAIVNIGSAAKDSALLSCTTSADGVISAKDCSVTKDMRRLVVASYVSSRGIFADATMYGTSITDYKNLLKPDGKLLPGAADFVVSDPNIQTFSLTGLIALGATLGVLLITVSIIMTIAHYHHTEKKFSPWVRFKVLSPPQLLRCVYEYGGDKAEAQKSWGCSSIIPLGEKVLGYERPP